MATAPTHILLEAALAYAVKGWHVFPCHTPTENGCSCTKREACTDIGKHPRTKNGLSDATTDEATIRKWWTMWPSANVAIRTGAISGLVVLDRDDYKGGADSLEKLERTYSPLPETVLALTGGGGQHYAFAHPGSHVTTAVDLLGPGLDTRADGGYIIAPPSLHKSGKRYAWEVLHEPDETALAPMPAWLLALCQATTRQERVEAGAPILDGQRGETLFKLGCSLRGRGFTEVVILAALREMNATQCQPPKTDAEVQKIVGSIAKYKAGPSQEDLHQPCNGETPGPAFDLAAWQTQLAASPDDARWPAVLADIETLALLPLAVWLQVKPAIKQLVPTCSLNDLERLRTATRKNAEQQGPAASERVEPPPPDSILAEALAVVWRPTLKFDLHRQAFMRYAVAQGIFHEVDDLEVDADLTTVLTRRLPAGFYTKTLRNVKYLLKSALHTRMASGPSSLVPFANGVLDLARMALQPHSPDFRFTWSLPYAYDPAATCPLTQAWLLEACRGRADQVEVLRAFLKAVLCGRTDIQRFPELVGPGGSGKGTFTRLAQGLVGLENVAVTELKYLESNRFETSNLMHKRLIVITDAEQWAGQITTLKALTGGDSIRVERKNVQKHPTAVAEGLVLVSANEAITSSDYTSGLDRRRIPIPFQHQPPGWRNLLEIKGGEFQGELAGEFPGVLNWVLAMPDAEMLRYLLQTSTVAPTLAASHARALVRTNPLAAWADERLTLDPTPGKSVEERSRPAGVKVGIARLEERSNRYEYENAWLYPNYVAYCQGTNTRSLSLRRFTDLLLDLLTVQLRLDTVKHKTTNKGSQVFGIRFREPQDENHDPRYPATDYHPTTPFLITGSVEPGGHPSPGEGKTASGEGCGEGLEAVDYGSEGIHVDYAPIYREGEERKEKGKVVGVPYRERVENPVLPSLPALARAKPSPDSSPTPHRLLTRDAREGGRTTLSYCTGCGRNSTWVVRTGQDVCYKCGTAKPSRREG